MSDIFREVDEDVRKDVYTRLWTAYGRYVIGGAVGIVLITAAWQGWSSWSLAQREADGARFIAALELTQQGRFGPAEAAFAELAQDARRGYATLARLQRAAALAGAGDRTAAVAEYDALAADSGVDETLRGLAALLAAQNLIDTANRETLARRLDPLLAEDSTWKYSARELSGLAALRFGDLEGARADFTALADDPATPQGVRARAAEILAAMGAGD